MLFFINDIERAQKVRKVQYIDNELYITRKRNKLLEKLGFSQFK